MTISVIQSKLLLDSGATNGVSLRVESKPGCFSMRQNGSGGTEEAGNRREFYSALGFEEHQVARCRQIHSDRVSFVRDPRDSPEADALVADRAGVLLAVSIADCVPILVFDRKLKIAAAVHAGWRGTSEGIVGKTMKYLRESFDSQPADIVAFIGPSAGACCYEVGDEVAYSFSPEYVKAGKSDGKFLLDLKLANRDQFLAKGVRVNDIEVSKCCTICDMNFHSFRRDGETSGRMLAAIGIK